MEYKQTCILVLGMHRSGTSVLTGVLNLLGVYLGSDLMKNEETNQKGHFENSNFYSFNDNLLLKMKSAWDDAYFDAKRVKQLDDTTALKKLITKEFSSHKLFAIKDPRIIYLFPLYEKALKELDIDIKIILPYRNPQEVALSLLARDGFSKEKGLLLWASYFFLAEQYSRKYSRYFVSFDKLIQDTKTTLQKLNDALHLGIIENYDKNIINSFLSKDLKHHNIKKDYCSQEIPSFIKDVLSFQEEYNSVKSFDKFNLVEEKFSKEKYFFYNTELRTSIKAKENHITNLDMIIKSEKEHIKNLETTIKGQKDNLKAKDNHIANLDMIIKSEKEHIKNLETTIKGQKDNLKAKDNHIANLDMIMREKDLQATKLQETIKTISAHVEILEKKNFDLLQLAESLSIKNRIKRILGKYKRCIYCRKELPYNYSNIFDTNGYIEANEDIKNALLNNQIDSAFGHFCSYGFDEIFRGDRKLLKDLPLYNDNDYKKSRPDVTLAIKNGSFEYSHFVHYLIYGHKEILQEQKARKKHHIKKKRLKSIANPNKIVKGFRILKSDGFQVFKKELKCYFENNKTYTYAEPKISSKTKSEIENFTIKPLISIIMPVYNVDPKWLDLAIKSIENQWYENWELCIADDKSTNIKTIKYLKNINNLKIKIKFLEKNLNISGASNEALKMATGEYIALMDNDDELTPNALYEVVKAINDTSAEFIYSDEDKLEMNGTFSDPHFKPDFAPDMFLSQNYISHLGVIKKSLIEKVDGFTIGLEGAQDYDLYLKVFEQTTKIYHIQKVLYHWRKIPGSTATEFSDKSYAQDAGIQSLQNAINRRGIDAKVENGKYPGTYRVKYAIAGNPLVSIIIPFKDKPELLTMCIESILAKSTYKNFELIGISNNSEEKATFDEMKRLKKLDSRIKFYEYNVPFNYSQINNHAVKKYAKGEHIVLLNNDIEIISPEWIESMLEHSQREEIGCVGAKLYYPNDTIQHAGITIGMLTLAGHNFKHHPKNAPAYMGRESVIYNVSAITAACLMVKTRIFKELQGLNEKNLKIAFNDVDFCLRVQEKGYRNIFTPYCEAYHHESISRGAEDTKEKQDRFKSEIEYMKKRHKTILENGDPYYNPSLTLEKENFSLR